MAVTNRSVTASTLRATRTGPSNGSEVAGTQRIVPPARVSEH
jgi:hypothetical protein